MNKRLLIIPLLSASALLGACDDHHNSNNTAANSNQDFSSFVQALIAKDTCQSKTSQDITSINFTFAPDQDQASPVDVDNVQPGCVF